MMRDTKKLFIYTTLLAGLPLAGAFFSRYYEQEYSPIPEKRMVIDGRDFKSGVLVKWPQKGVATIISPKFTLAFEGESWSELSLIKAEYKVDGRYGGLFPIDSEPFREDMGNGVEYEYSARQREASIFYKKHRFVYCDYLNLLKVDGKEYSTANAPVQLVISRDGVIKRL